MLQRSRRLWYYFRTGHGVYLGFLISMANFVTVQYVLFVERFPGLEWLSLRYFVISFVTLYGIVAVLAGWFHKRTQLSVENDITTLANPYVWKAAPGKERDLMVPMQIFNLETGRYMLTQMGMMTPELSISYKFWIDQLKKLQRGEEIRGT